MITLHDGHVLGTSGYVTGKCKRCDKVLCNSLSFIGGDFLDIVTLVLYYSLFVKKISVYIF